MLVSVLGAVNDQKKQKSPEKSVAKDKGKSKKHSTPLMPAKPFIGIELKALDQKWSDCFSRLEVILVARSFSTRTDLPDCESDTDEPASVPPASVVKESDLFILPTQPLDRPLSVDRPQLVDQPQTGDRTKSTDRASTDQLPALLPQLPSTLVTESPRQFTNSEMDTDSDADFTD